MINYTSIYNDINNFKNKKDDIIDKLDNILYLLERIESILNRTKI